MDDRQKQTLSALAWMVEQYLNEDADGLKDSFAMSAGEGAITALAAFGYMEEVVDGSLFGRWTEAGQALLNWDERSETFPTPPASRQ